MKSPRLQSKASGLTVRRYVGLRAKIHEDDANELRRVRVFNGCQASGELITVLDRSVASYAYDGLTSVDWGSVAVGPVATWKLDDWESGGAGAYTLAFSLLSDIMPVRLSWSIVWPFLEEVVLSLPRTEEEIVQRESARRFSLRDFLKSVQGDEDLLLPESLSDQTRVGFEPEWEITERNIREWVLSRPGPSNMESFLLHDERY